MAPHFFVLREKPIMTKQTKFFFAACLALAVIFTALAVTRPAPAYHPHLVVRTPTSQVITFVLDDQKNEANCRRLIGQLASVTQTTCPACQIDPQQCLSQLPDDLQSLYSAARLDYPSARFPNGVVGYTADNPSQALAECMASEKVGAGQKTAITCYAAHSERTFARPGAADINPMWAALAALSAFAAAMTLLYGKGGKQHLQELGGSLLNRLGAIPRRGKQLVMLAIDVLTLESALWLAFTLRLERIYVPAGDILWLFFALPFIAFPLFVRMGLYHAIIRYLGTTALSAIFRAVALYTLLVGAIVFLTKLEGVPRSVVVINGILVLLLVSGSRLVAREWFSRLQMDHRDKTDHSYRDNVVIYGAGSAGMQLATALSYSREMKPVAFIDDDATLHQHHLAGLKVYSFADLPELINIHAVRSVLLAIPSVSRQRRNEILKAIEPLPVRVLTLPSVSELAQGKIQLGDLREVSIEDLLGRDPVPPKEDLLKANIDGKAVLVTGAGGSIGSELCRQIASLGASSLILYENSEYALYAIEKELLRQIGHPPIYPILGSVLDQPRLERTIQSFGVQTIFHAAAYKHVPMVEKNPVQGVVNNIFGTYHAAQAALNTGVDTFVLISTDKAVRPTNTMGTTKRFAEMILQALHHQHPDKTRFTMVRFGNVLGSSGSVVPLFREQIRHGGPITVTDPRIIRYFMTIPEAAQLVIQAGAMGQGSDVFVLDMGEPVKILDLATRMIHLSGLTEKTPEHPDGDIEIIFSGLRPGEKLYEELLIGDNVSPTDHPRVMQAKEKMLPWQEIQDLLARLRQACEVEDSEQVRGLLLAAVEEFKPQCGNEDLLRKEDSEALSA